MQQLDDLEARQLTGVARRLDLVVVEVSRHGDERGVEQVAGVVKGAGQHVAEQAQDLGGRLRRLQGLRANGEGAFQAHEALDRGERQSGRVRQGPEGHGGAAGDDALLFGVVADDRGERRVAALVRAGDERGVGGVQHCDDAVGGAEVDADTFANLVRGT